MSNEFDAAVAATMQPDQGQAARVGFSVAADTNPDAYAEAQRVARRTGVPVDTVLAMPKEMKQQDTMGTIDFDALAKTAPATASLLSDIERAKVAHDNVESMTALEAQLNPRLAIGKIDGPAFQRYGVATPVKRSFLGTLGDVGVTAVKGAIGLPQAFVGLADIPTFGYVGKGLDAIGIRFNDAQAIASGWYSPAQQRANRAVQQADGFFDTLGAAVSNPSTIATTVGESLPQMLGGAGIARGLMKFLPKASPLLAAAAGEGIIGAGSAAESIRAQTPDELLNLQQSVSALGSGAMTAVFGMMGGKLAQRLGIDDIDTALARGNLDKGAVETAKRGFVARLAGGGISEGLFEELPQSAQEQMWQNFATGRPIGEGVENAMAMGLLAGTTMGGGFQAVNYLADRQKTQRAEKSAEFLDGLNKLVQADKLVARDPQTFEQFVAQAAEAGPVQQVFIDAKTLMQSGVAEQVAAVSPAVASQLATATQTGGQIAIPVEEYAARIAPTEYAQGLLDHLKTDPEGFSRAEAQQFMQSHAEELQAEVERILADKQGDDTFKASAEVVRADIKAQLDTAARFTPQVNDAYSAMVGNFYAVTAAKLGTTPEELFQRYPLKVGAERIDGQQFDQEAVQTDTPEFRNSKVVDADGKPLVFYHGGALDFTGMRAGGRFGGAIFVREGAPSGYGDAQHALYVKGPILELGEMAEMLDGASGQEVLSAAIGREIDDDQAAMLADALTDGSHYPDSGRIWDLIGAIDEADAQVEIQKLRGAVAKGLGFDAVRTPDEFDGETVMILSPDQIESANGNSGAFDPQDPNILHQFAETEQAYGGQAAYDQAKADGKTKLNYRQWVQVRTPAFKQWFGDWENDPANASKVIDPTTGEPMVVYHGTQSERDYPSHLDFEKGNPREGYMVWDKTPNGLTEFKQGAGTAMWFAPDPDRASDYASSAAGNSTVYPVFLNLRNPMTYDAEGRRFTDPTGDKRNNNRGSINDMTAAAKDDGHDGAIFENIIDPGSASNMSPRTSIAVFSPTQIKSAIGNSGAFSETDPNILKQGTGNRGAFNPASLSITLLKNADLSTFLHESGHFFLEVQADLASKLQQEAEIFGMDTLKPGERQILADTDALLRWFGVRDLAEWHNLDFEQKRSYHEQFARGFEAYLFEGKAPSIELQGLFQRFRAWLLSVYRELKALNVELTDEVRGVFDRMLATNEQITLAEQGRSMMPLFKNFEDAQQTLGWTVEQYAEYQALGVQPTQDAIEDLQARGLRDMQWLHNARAREIRKLQRRHRALRAEAMSEARQEVMQQPVYRADRFLRYGELELLPGASQNVRRAAEQANLDGAKLSLPALKEMYGEGEAAIWRYLPTGKRGLAASEGMHPDLVAEMFGFSSGDAMVRELISVPSFKEAVNAATDALMLERHGDLSSPEAIEKAADKAIHNDARARFVATEANALAKATGQRKVLASAAKEFARAMIARLKIRNIKPGQYANAEVRAAKAAEKARNSGDIATAAAEKRNQLIQNYATRAAYDAQEEVDKGLRYLKKFSKKVNGLDADYADQISQLLEGYDLRSRSLTEIDRAKSMRSWVMSRLANGEIPDIADSLLSPKDRAAFIAQTSEIDENGEYVYADDGERIKLLADYLDRSEKVSWRDLSVEQFRGLVDTVREIEHLGKRKNRLLTDKEGKALDQIKDEIAGSIRTHARKSGQAEPTRDDIVSKAKRGSGKFMADHIRMSVRALVMDGGKDGGAMYEYFIRPANEAEQKKLDLNIRITEKLNAIMSPILKEVSIGDRMLAGKKYEALETSLNWNNRFAILLNLGNEGNMQRLLSGGVGGRKGLTLQDLMPVMSEFSKAELLAAQEVFDLFESLRPELAALERETKGKEPEWIPPRAITLRSREGELVTLRGGYFPIVYDPASTPKVQENLDAEDGNASARAARSAAEVRASFVKPRAVEVHGRPLLLTLDSMFSGFSNTIHYLSYQRYALDMSKLLKSKRIQDAMLEHYGPESLRQLRSFVSDLVLGPQRLNDTGEKTSAFLRKNISMSLLAVNINSWLKQPFGIANAVPRLGGGAEGAKWVGKGLYYFSMNPARAIRETMDASAFIKNRPRTRFRELNEIRNKMQVETVGQKLAPWMMSGMAYTQLVADVIVWRAAYERAVHDNPAISDKKLVAIADQAVRDSQGGGEQVDQSAIERGGAMMNLFTTLFNFQNTGTNLGYLTANTERGMATKMVDFLMVFTVPVMVDALFAALLIPSNDDGDDEGWWKKAAANQITYLMGSFAFVREFSPAIQALFGEGFGYKGPTGLKMVSDALILGQQINQGELDDAFRKAAVNLLGDFTGLPAAQINRTLTGAQALNEGETENPAALVFGFKKAR